LFEAQAEEEGTGEFAVAAGELADEVLATD
jgi:hypothetical protein